MNFESLTKEQIDGILFGENYENAVKSDFAVLLGSAPEYAPKRADIAFSFYNDGGTDRIIASGGMNSDSRVTECAVMKEELIKLGVPSSAVIEEPSACDTIQNMTCSLTEIVKRCDIMTVKRITVISEPFHMKRALCLAKLLLPEFIEVCGYTQGTEKQRKEWNTDDRLKNCVKTEIEVLKQLIEKGRISDIECP